LLNLICPGMGYVYVGRRVWALVAVLVAVAAVFSSRYAITVFDFGVYGILLWSGGALVVPFLTSVHVAFAAIRFVAGRAPWSSVPWHRYLIHGVLAIGMLIAGWYIAPQVKLYSMPTTTMEDCLLVGDYILADMDAYQTDGPKGGDVVVFIYPGDLLTPYVKRCVGVQNDTILIQDKQLYVNGTAVELGTVKFIDTTVDGSQRIMPRRPGGRDSRDNFGPYIVPQDCYFMMGDNRDNSADSRLWGVVRRDLVLGKAARILLNRSDWSRCGRVIH
jgi:signal peptidase I